MTFGKRGFPLAWLLALLFFWGGTGGAGLSSVIAADQPPGMSRAEDGALGNDFSDGEAWLTGEDAFLNDYEDIAGEGGIADPLEPLNRIFFQFNDSLYYWVVRPVSTVYGQVVAEGIRISIRNFFKNLSAPVRVVNNFLQGKVRSTGVELVRFTINSTVGIVGFGDPAKDMGLMASEEDLGQTLGVYGIGDGIYLHWPLLGPSSLRDSVGTVGDAFLEPMTYLAAGRPRAGIGVFVGRRVNDSSLALGDYELFEKTSLDPYTAIRNAYYQFRRGRVLDQNPGDGDLLGSGSSAVKKPDSIVEKVRAAESESMAEFEGANQTVSTSVGAVEPVVLSGVAVESVDTEVVSAPADEKGIIPQSESVPEAVIVTMTQSPSTIVSAMVVTVVSESKNDSSGQVEINQNKSVVSGIPQRSSIRINPEIFTEY